MLNAQPASGFDVLILEPDTQVADSLTRALVTRGYRVAAVVQSFEQARHQLRQQRYNTVVGTWRHDSASDLSRDFGVVVAGGMQLLAPGSPNESPACIVPKPLNGAQLSFAIHFLVGANGSAA
jgi:hypothetical protein